MPSVSAFDVVAVALTFVLAGLVKGVTGMSLPTVAMGLLGSIMAPASAAALLVLPSFVTNIWQMLDGSHLAALARTAVADDDLRRHRHACGFAAARRRKQCPRDARSRESSSRFMPASACWRGPVLVAPHMEKWLSPVVGIVTGAITGATGDLRDAGGALSAGAAPRPRRSGSGARDYPLPYRPWLWPSDWPCRARFMPARWGCPRWRSFRPCSACASGSFFAIG